MAEEWIRVNAKLLQHPKLFRIANHLLTHSGLTEWATVNCPGGVLEDGVAESLALCGLLRTWCAANEHGRTENDDVVIGCCTLKTLDSISGLVGFGAAMAEVGWAIEEDGKNIRFPNFLTYNITPEERRKIKDRERKERKRCGQNADKTRTRCGQTGATEQNRTEHDRTEYKPDRSGPDLHAQTGSSDRDRTDANFRKLFYAKVAFAFGWGEVAAEKQKGPIYAVAKRIERLPNRAAMAERIYAAARDKKNDPLVKNPPAAWQAEVNRILEANDVAR